MKEFLRNNDTNHWYPLRETKQEKACASLLHIYVRFNNTSLGHGRMLAIP